MLAVLAFSSVAQASRVQTFLKSCGWGTLAGAGVGVLSLAFEDKPSEHTVNVARGASLGLYGGILFGVSQLQQRQKIEDGIGLAPTLDREGQIVGAHALAVFRF